MANILQVKDSFSVLIPDGESELALPVLQCLGDMKNVTLYVLSNDPWVRVRFSRFTTHFYNYPKIKGEVKRLSAIIEIVKKKKIDVLLPVDEPAIRLLSQHFDTLSQLTSIVNLPKTDDFDIASNKWLLSEWLKNNQILAPTTILYKNDVRFDDTLSDISFPVLIKPVRGSGGKGIIFFDSASALKRYFNEHNHSMDFIVQSYIYGHDIDCSVLCQNGNILAYTIQKKIIEKTINYAPSGSIEFLYDNSTYNIVKEVIKKFNWSGIVHFDLRYDEQDKQIKVIEMNPRYWASILGSLSAGVNFPYLACLSGLKRNLPIVEANPILFVNAPTAFKMFVQDFFHKNKAIQNFDKSNFQSSLRDPFPSVIGVCFQIYKKLLKKKVKTTRVTIHKQNYALKKIRFKNLIDSISPILIN